jgi:hypothetical protein
MATKKQRSRRAKTFRHEHALIDYDDEGNEIEVTASELRARKNKPEKPARRGGARRQVAQPASRPSRPGTASRRGASSGADDAGGGRLLLFKSMPIARGSWSVAVRGGLRPADVRDRPHGLPEPSLS